MEVEFSRFRLELGKDVLEEIIGRYSPGDTVSASVGRAVEMVENIEATRVFYTLMDSLLEYGNKNPGARQDAAYLIVNLTMSGAQAARDEIIKVLSK